MKNRIIKYAFSLAEAIIIVTVLGVALTAATPFLTKKLVNVAESGSASHGRYEIFMQEFIKFGTKCKSGDGCKKIYKSRNNETKRYVTVYQKLSDAEYYMVMKAEGNPDDKCEPKPFKKHKDGDNDRYYKPTIYAVIDEEAELASSDNSMTLAKSKDGKNTYQRSSKIIFEPTDVTYEHPNNKESLSSNQRVIEGNLTDKLTLRKAFSADYDVKTKNCYIINEKNENDYNGEVKSKPWIRMIVGSQRIVKNEEATLDKDGKLNIQCYHLLKV